METFTEVVSKLEAKCEKLNYDIQSLIRLVHQIKAADKKSITGHDLFREKFIKMCEEDKNEMTESINLWLTMERMNKIMNKEIDDEWELLDQKTKDSYNIAAIKRSLYQK